MHVNEVYEGDCLDVMRQFPDNCIDTIITDPPYSLSSIKRRFAKTSIDDDNLTGQAAKNGTHQYGRLSAGFMGKDWDNEIAFNPEVWREALRVAKPGATLMAFGGTRTYHRMVCAIEDAGWEIRDCISYFHDGNQAERAFMASLNEEQLAAYLELHYPGRQMAWVYGEGFPKSANVSKLLDKQAGAEREFVGKAKGAGKQNPAWNGTLAGRKENSLKPEFPITAPATLLAQQWDGWGTALKPAYEPIVCAMKPVEGGYARNAEKWGVSGIWVDGARIPANGESLNGGAYSGESGKCNGTSYIIGQKAENFPEPKGRWPANIIHDSSPEVEAEFAKAGVRTSNGGKGRHKIQATKNRNGNRVVYGEFGASNDLVFGDSGSASRFFYTAKASPSERRPYNNHPTVKPLSLLRYLAKLTKTPTGGIVLDPFAGSGTTGLACIPEGRDYILIEKEAEYAEICRRRIAEYTGQEIAVKEIEITENERTKQLSLW